MHLGQDVVVPVSTVVAIVDVAAIQRRGLALPEVVSTARAHGSLVELADGAGTSLVVTTDRVYLSPISPMTLRRRAMAPLEDDIGTTSALAARRRRRRARASKGRAGL